MGIEQLEFDFDESENKNELNGSVEPKRGPVTRICSRCGQPFILSAGTTDDMCWECCQEEKSEDEEQENARLFHGFSRDSNAYIPVETTPKKKTQKRKSLKEYTIPVRLNDEYDKSWIGKKICIKGGRGRGKTGTIVDVHKYRLNIVTDDGREYSEIYPENVFMKPDAKNNGAVQESRHRAFDDEPGWEHNNGRGRSRMSNDAAIALEKRVDDEYEDNENENDIRELEERISKANEEINKKRREVDDEQYASDAQWERKKELISAQKKKADLVRELEEKRYGKAVVNEPSAKYLRGLKKAIDQGGRMKGGKSSGEHSVNESEFMEALKEVGFGRAMCESINNIRKAVFESRLGELLKKAEDENEKKEKEEYEDSLRYYGEFRDGYDYGDYDYYALQDHLKDRWDDIARYFFPKLYDRVNELDEKIRVLNDEYMYTGNEDDDDEYEINLKKEYDGLKEELERKVKEKIKELCASNNNDVERKVDNNGRKDVYEGAGDITCSFDPDSAIRDYEDYCDEQSMIREYGDEIAKKYFKELCDHIDDLENEACYIWSRIENAIRDGVQGKELKEIEKEYYQCVAEKEVSLDKLKDKVNEKIIELNKSNPDEYPLVLVESRLGEMFAPAMKKVKNVALAGALAGNMALAQPSDDGDDYYQNNYNNDSPAYDVGNDGWDNMTPDHLNAVSQDVGAKVTVVGDSPVADISDMGYLERKKKDVDKYKYVDMDELFSNEVGRVSSDHDRDFVMGFGHGESSNIHEAARLAAAAAKEDFREVMSDEMELINANAGSSSIDLPLSEDDELYDVKYFYDEASKIYHAFVMRVERGYTKWALDHNMESSSSVSERMKRISKIR